MTTWRDRLRALGQRPAQRWLLTGMSICLVLPFFGPGEGCAGSAPFPCEADPVLAAAEKMIEVWVARSGDPYALEVEPFECPDHGRLDGEVRVPVDSLLGDDEDPVSRCSAHTHWRDRRDQRAGDHLKQRLRDRFLIERDEPVPRRPRQPDVKVRVACDAGEGPGDLVCEVSAELFVPATGGQKRSGAVDRQTREVRFHVPLDPEARPLATPPSVLELAALAVSAGMGPKALIDGGVDGVDFIYLFALMMTALCVTLARRGWWPQLDRLATGAVALVVGFVVLVLGADAFQSCESLCAAFPDQSLRAWLDAFLRRAQLGALLFGPLALARFVILVRGSVRRTGSEPPSSG